MHSTPWYPGGMTLSKRLLTAALVLLLPASVAGEETSFLGQVTETSQAVTTAAKKTNALIKTVSPKVPGWEEAQAEGQYETRSSKAYKRDGVSVRYEGLFNVKTNNWIIGYGRVIPAAKRQPGEVRVKEYGPRKNGVRCLAVDVFGQQNRWHYVTVTQAIQAVNAGQEPKVPVYEATADTEPEARVAASNACTANKPAYGSTCMVFCDGAAGSIRTRMFGTTAP